MWATHTQYLMVWNMFATPSSKGALQTYRALVVRAAWVATEL